MSKRKDIKDGLRSTGDKRGLIYTKVLGWIDLGHACGDDSRRLKTILFEEKGRKYFPEFQDWYFPVDYFQEFGFDYLQFGKVVERRVGINSPLMVRSCLSWEVKRRIALTIMMKTAFRFEAFQQSFAFSWYTDSGFSCEDLISDLVGFYRVFGNGTDPIVLSYPTTLGYALKIWDHYGPVGKFKNKELRPLLFPAPSPMRKFLPRKGLLPSWLDYIKPLNNLRDKYIYNRYESKPVKNLLHDTNRMNHELYTSIRYAGWDFDNGHKNTNTPSMLYTYPHEIIKPEYFELRN